MMTGTNTSRSFYHRIMPTGFCICSFQDSLRKTIALFLLVHGHARLSGQHVGDVCTGYAPKESFLNEGFYHSFIDSCQRSSPLSKSSSSRERAFTLSLTWV